MSLLRSTRSGMFSVSLEIKQHPAANNTRSESARLASARPLQVAGLDLPLEPGNPGDDGSM